jgi:choline kinase
VIKPDPAAFTRLSKDADGASVNATAFFDVSERFLVADRKVTREDAVMTYDNVAHSAGDRFKSVEVALQAAKPCPELYNVCRGAFPQVCNDASALTN